MFVRFRCNSCNPRVQLYSNELMPQDDFQTNFTFSLIMVSKPKLVNINLHLLLPYPTPFLYLKVFLERNPKFVSHLL